MPGEAEIGFVPIDALSARGSGGLDRKSVTYVQDEIRNTYIADDRPWVIGYSGGKDSTATVQIVWYALANLTPEKRGKPVYVIAADTCPGAGDRGLHRPHPEPDQRTGRAGVGHAVTAIASRRSDAERS